MQVHRAVLIAASVSVSHYESWLVDSVGDVLSLTGSYNPSLPCSVENPETVPIHNHCGS